jgi:DNA repair exonuclease SbcCD ATPase subunit
MSGTQHQPSQEEKREGERRQFKEMWARAGSTEMFEKVRADFPDLPVDDLVRICMAVSGAYKCGTALKNAKSVRLELRERLSKKTDELEKAASDLENAKKEANENKTELEATKKMLEETKEELRHEQRQSVDLHVEFHDVEEKLKETVEKLEKKEADLKAKTDEVAFLSEALKVANNKVENYKEMLDKYVVDRNGFLVQEFSSTSIIDFGFLLTFYKKRGNNDDFTELYLQDGAEESEQEVTLGGSRSSLIICFWCDGVRDGDSAGRRHVRDRAVHGLA